jgi:FixJ family two-component response regulator
MIQDRKHIAIVDDDPGVLRALGRLVRTLGYETIAYGSGEALLSDLGQTVPACAILDQHLPGLTGLEILTELARATPPVAAVLITGLDEPGLRERCLVAGAVAYVLKPVSKVEIEAAIEKATHIGD